MSTFKDDENNRAMTAARAFQNAVLDYYRLPQARTGLSSQSFKHHREAVISALQQDLEGSTEIAAQQQPVCRFLEGLVNTINLAEYVPLKESIRALMPYLHWKVNSNYQNVFPQHFFDNESYNEIIGPGGLLKSNTMRAGLLLLGEEADYPSHSHAATEWYHLLNGNSLWQQGKNGYSLREPGGAIFHGEWETHAMRGDGQATIALWSWAGDLDSEASPD